MLPKPQHEGRGSLFFPQFAKVEMVPFLNTRRCLFISKLHRGKDRRLFWLVIMAKPLSLNGSAEVACPAGGGRFLLPLDAEPFRQDRGRMPLSA